MPVKNNNVQTDEEEPQLSPSERRELRQMMERDRRAKWLASTIRVWALWITAVLAALGFGFDAIKKVDARFAWEPSPGARAPARSGTAALLKRRAVRCVTHREQPIYQAVLPGFFAEHCLLGGLAIGTTLCPARSLEIHCTRKRAVNSNCATSPKASQKSNLATNTS